MPSLIGNLTDNFDDNSIDPSKWVTSGSGTVVEQNQRVEITGPPNAQGWERTALLSLVEWTFTGSGVFCECDFTNATDAVDSEWVFRVDDVTNTRQVRFRYENGGLAADWNYGAWNFGTPVTYNPITHRWLRMRESGGTVYWEVSSDGQVWNPFFSLVIAPPANVELGFYHQSGPVIANPGTAWFDNVNAGASEIVRPVADLATGGWTDDGGGSVGIYAAIDEVVRDDGDLIQSPPSPSNAEAKFTMTATSIAGVPTVRYAYGKDAAGGEQVDIVVTLYDTDGSTVLATKAHVNIGAALVVDSFQHTAVAVGQQYVIGISANAP